jgi:hypothetical protein
MNEHYEISNERKLMRKAEETKTAAPPLYAPRVLRCEIHKFSLLRWEARAGEDQGAQDCRERNRNGPKASYAGPRLRYHRDYQWINVFMH